jgi:predicted  nucleic acid-binding Zn-ribbon protein
MEETDMKGYALFVAALILAGCPTKGDKDPVDTDTEVPVDTDTEVPVDTDTEVPVDTDTEVPVDTDEEDTDSSTPQIVD